MACSLDFRFCTRVDPWFTVISIKDPSERAPIPFLLLLFFCFPPLRLFFPCRSCFLRAISFFASTFVPAVSHAYFYILRRRLSASVVGGERKGRGEEEKKRERKHSVRNIISPSRRIFNFLESSVKLKRILRERIRFASSRAGFLLTNCEKPCYMNKTLRCRLFHGYVHRSIWEGAFCLPKRGHHRLLLARSAPFYAILASKQVSRE